MAKLPDAALPTAHALVPDTAATPFSMLLEPTGFGLGHIRQLLPFQRSISVLLTDVAGQPLPLNPTAHTSEPETAATPFSWFTAATADTAAMLQLWHLPADEPAPAVTVKPQLKINANMAATRQRARCIACPPALNIPWAGLILALDDRSCATMPRINHKMRKKEVPDFLYRVASLCAVNISVFCGYDGVGEQRHTLR